MTSISARELRAHFGRPKRRGSAHVTRDALPVIHLDLSNDDMPDDREISEAMRRAAAIRQDEAFVRAVIALHPERRFTERPCDTERDDDA